MTEKKRKPCGAVKKILAMVFLMLTVFVTTIAVRGVLELYDCGAYAADSEELKEQFLEEKMSEVARVTLKKHVLGWPSDAFRYAKENNCSYVVRKDGWIISSGVMEEYVWSKEYRFSEYEAGRYVFADVEDYSITLFLHSNTIFDEWETNFWVIRNSDWLRIVFPAVAFLGVLGGLWSAWFLIKRIGWSPKSEVVTAGRFGRIPSDLFTLLCLLWGGVWFILCNNIFGKLPVLKDNLVFYGLFLLSSVWLLSIIARLKAKTLWANLTIKKIGSGMCRSLVKLPFIWRMFAILFFCCLIEGVVLFTCMKFWEEEIARGILVSFWLAEKVILVPLVIFVILQLGTLKTAGKALADGKMDYKVDESTLWGDLKEHARHLNSISDGVNLAVQERMKSEHFKTELITNVSHDIKTPLTSIINYSDLLCKEDTDNEKIREYAGVIHRQSGRLKKLIEDLMEASKASTGNLDVKMEECQVTVLLEQAVGEFESRLFEKNIDVITKIPTEPIKVMADGRLLWRVFENLLNNICKYTQKDTRVYLSAEQEKDLAVITFKNISEYPLDITEEELMERFVRGDKSRHTEGNGLGLNIAKSLVELQNGTMKLIIDGDLFKVILTFPITE